MANQRQTMKLTERRFLSFEIELPCWNASSTVSANQQMQVSWELCALSSMRYFYCELFLAYLRFVFKLRLWLSQSLLADNHNTPDTHFTARRYAQARSLLSSCVCPSVRQSITLVVVKLLVPPGSPITLAFLSKTPVHNSKGNPFSEDTKVHGVGENFAIFD